MQSRKILGVRVDFGLGVPDVLAKIDEFIRKPGSHSLFTVNPEFVMKAQKDTALLNVLNNSDLSVPDGAGILFAQKYEDWVAKQKKSTQFPVKALFYGAGMGIGSLIQKNAFGGEVRLAGSELIYDICSHAEKNGFSVFFLGGWEKDSRGRMKSHHGNIADKAAKIMKEKFPNLKIIGASSAFSWKEEDISKSLTYIQECMSQSGVTSLDILLVGFTSGVQEKWISRNISKIPAKVGIGVGSSFDFIIQNYEKAPKEVISKNLEWLYRLVKQPWRIKRILMSFPVFPLLVYWSSIKSLRQK